MRKQHRAQKKPRRCLVCYVIAALAIFISGIGYMDSSTEYVAEMPGKIISTYPKITKYPAPIGVLVEAQDGTVFKASLPGTSTTPGFVYVYGEGTPVTVTVWKSAIFGRMSYEARLAVP